jgi:hypothetical protein
MYPQHTPLELDGGLAELRRDCARMVPHWAAGPPDTDVPAPPARLPELAGVVVPVASATLLNGMSEYGD